MPHTDALVVLTTVADAAEAEALVLALLDRRLIACGTINPPSKLKASRGLPSPFAVCVGSREQLATLF